MSLADVVRDALRRHQKVELPGVGSFEVRTYAPYEGRRGNGEVVKVPEKKLVFFRGSATFRKWLAANVGADKEDLDEFDDELRPLLSELLRRGYVRFSDLGLFTLRSTPTRHGRNPQTGEKIEIPARTLATFKSSGTLRDIVAGGEPSVWPAPTTNADAPMDIERLVAACGTCSFDKSSELQRLFDGFTDETARADLPSESPLPAPLRVFYEAVPLSPLMEASFLVGGEAGEHVANIEKTLTEFGHARPDGVLFMGPDWIEVGAEFAIASGDGPAFSVTRGVFEEEGVTISEPTPLLPYLQAQLLLAVLETVRGKNTLEPGGFDMVDAFLRARGFTLSAEWL